MRRAAVRVGLTGASGLLGTWLRRTCPPGVEIVAVSYRSRIPDLTAAVRADLRDHVQTVEAIASAGPELVIHSAYARDRASIVDATTNVVQAANACGAELVHMSTEAVFAGDGRPRSETDEPDPVWEYGRWKADAEQRAVCLVREATVVRLPLLVSLDPPDGGAKRLLDAARDGVTVDWYEDERRQPAWAHEIAAALWRLVDLPSHERAGHWHLPGPELLSRYELGQRTAQLLGLEHDPSRPAPRPQERTAPRDLQLDGHRAKLAIGWNPTPITGDASYGHD